MRNRAKPNPLPRVLATEDAINVNVDQKGLGILWAVVPVGVAARYGGTPGVLYAFDASDITKPPLWSSDKDPKDALGGNAKFSMDVKVE